MKYILRLLVLGFGLLQVLPTARVAAQTPDSTAAIAEARQEYENYRKRGDELFGQGRYTDAKRQYLNCFEVPRYEKDVYALEQIKRCDQALTLQQQLLEARAQQNGPLMEQLYLNILEINGKDPAMRQQLGDLYEQQASVHFNQRQYAEARRQVDKALLYSDRKLILEETRRRIDAEQNKPPLMYTPKRTGAKLAVGLVAMGSAGYALMLRNQYTTKLSALNRLAAEADPTGSGTIASPDAYRRYTEAYAEAEAAKVKNGTYTALLGVAAVALAAEVFLLVKKPKARRVAVGISPLPKSPAVAATFRF